jgi:carbon monoxide dehydrogenase subunit G
MRLRRRTAALATGAAALAITAGLGVAVAAVGSESVADPSQLADMSGQAVYPAGVATMWSFTEDAASLCRLLPDCISATAVPGRKDVYTVTLDINSPALPLVPALSATPVRVEITDRNPGADLHLHLAIDNATGTFDSDAVLGLAPAGRGASRLTYKTISASGTGLTGQIAIASMGESMQRRLTQASRAYAQVQSSQPTAVLTATSGRVARGRTATQVTGKLAVFMPAGVGTPTAVGRMNVYVQGRKVCSSAIVGLTSTCRLPKGTPPGATATVTMTGRFSNGLPLNQGTTIRIRGAR